MAWAKATDTPKNPAVVAVASKALEIIDITLTPIWEKAKTEKLIYDELKTVGFLMGVLKDVAANLDTENPYSNLSDEELKELAIQYAQDSEEDTEE